jgi:4-hydroxy-tetrahydrodipicolinate synthase
MLEFVAKGALTALVTPFTDDSKSIDWGAFERLVGEQLDAKVSGLVPCGTTGEAPTLTLDEQRQLIEKTVTLARGRACVLAGTGTNCTQTSIERTQMAFEAGADAVMVVAPYYNKPSQEGLFQHVKAIAAVARGPVVIYDVPNRTSVRFSVDTVCRITEACANVVAIKDATNGVHHCQALMRRLGGRLSVLCGDDALTLPLMSVGARGVISVTSNVLPAKVVELVEFVVADQWQKARAAHERLLPVHGAMFHAPSPTPAKVVLSTRGLMSDAVRLPLVRATQKEREHILAAMKEYEA